MPGTNCLVVLQRDFRRRSRASAGDSSEPSVLSFGFAGITSCYKALKYENAPACGFARRVSATPCPRSEGGSFATISGAGSRCIVCSLARNGPCGLDCATGTSCDCGCKGCIGGGGGGGLDSSSGTVSELPNLRMNGIGSVFAPVL